MLRNNLMLPTEALDIPEAIDFDGTNDYLSRSSDLMGNADGKTFTFSAWVWWNGNAATSYIYASDSNYFTAFHNNVGTVTIRGKNSSGTDIVDVAFPANTLEKNTFNHLLVSCDLSDNAKRNVCVNGVILTPTWATYVNGVIDFTRTLHAVGATTVGASKVQGRLAHLYLDYTYRDLSVEANRRLFITADRKPAQNQQALNPILYLPMTDPTQPGKNLGTGGDFNLTGVVARSGRGPNQFNAPYSDLDGAADYLSKTTDPTGMADGQQFTLAFCVNQDAQFSSKSIIGNANSYFNVLIDAGVLTIICNNSSATRVLTFTATSAFALSRNYHVVISINLASSLNRHIYVNGSSVSGTWSTYSTSGVIDFTRGGWAVGARSGPDGWLDGRLGNVFFDTRYIDLSQPDNLAKFVTGTGIDAKPVDLGANGELPTGTPPLIYLPMYGNNAGKNYGTGGDFTVNSGPYPGARGPNEFWGNKADFNGTTGYLSRTSALTGVSDGKTFSARFILNPDTVAAGQGNIFSLFNASNGKFGLTIQRDAAGIRLYAHDVTNAGAVLDLTISSSFSAGVSADVFICIDLTNTAKRFVYVNDVQKTISVSTYTNANMLLNTGVATVGAYSDGTYKIDGKLSEFYFTTTYIDFSQEANRLKFRDAFGNPVALQPQIEAGTLPNPAIYMRFDPANFGKNSGTGGDFTVNGTITDGGQL